MPLQTMQRFCGLTRAEHTVILNEYQANHHSWLPPNQQGLDRHQQPGTPWDHDKRDFVDINPPSTQVRDETGTAQGKVIAVIPYGCPRPGSVNLLSQPKIYDGHWNATTFGDNVNEAKDFTKDMWRECRADDTLKILRQFGCPKEEAGCGYGCRQPVMSSADYDEVQKNFMQNRLDKEGLKGGCSLPRTQASSRIAHQLSLLSVPWIRTLIQTSFLCHRFIPSMMGCVAGSDR